MKQTVEEAARQYCKKNFPYSEHLHLTMSTAFEAGAEWYRNRLANMPWNEAMNEIAGVEPTAKQSPWISVEERLPGKDGYYVVTDGENIGTAYFFKEWNKFAQYEEYPHPFYKDDVIKLYMPIPSFDEILEANKDVLQRLKDK